MTTSHASFGQFSPLYRAAKFNMKTGKVFPNINVVLPSPSHYHPINVNITWGWGDSVMVLQRTLMSEALNPRFNVTIISWS